MRPLTLTRPTSPYPSGPSRCCIPTPRRLPPQQSRALLAESDDERRAGVEELVSQAVAPHLRLRQVDEPPGRWSSGKRAARGPDLPSDRDEPVPHRLSLAALARLDEVPRHGVGERNEVYWRTERFQDPASQSGAGGAVASNVDGSVEVLWALLNPTSVIQSASR